MVVPFAGANGELRDLLSRLDALVLGPQDELLVAVNHGEALDWLRRRRPASASFERSQQRGGGPRPTLLDAGGLSTPAHARNRAAQAAGGDWLVFLDADTEPMPRLLPAYFDPLPADATAVLAGGIRDTAEKPSLAARHVVRRAQMSQQATLTGARPYALSANLAVRRRAFLQVGGFEDTARAGEDADLCLRLAAAGWALEERPAALVEHRARETVPALLRQLAVHGAGAAWLERRHPGSLPAPSALALASRLARETRRGVRALAAGDAEEAGDALVELLGAGAFELGRLRSNRVRPARLTPRPPPPPGRRPAE